MKRHTAKYEMNCNIKTLMKLSVLFKHKYTDKKQKFAKKKKTTPKTKQKRKTLMIQFPDAANTHKWVEGYEFSSPHQ